MTRQHPADKGFRAQLPLPVLPPLISQAKMVGRIERIRREENQTTCPTCKGQGTVTAKETRR
jgi:hypothetical protein